MCQFQFCCTMTTTAVSLSKNECAKNEYKLCFFFPFSYIVFVTQKKKSTQSTSPSVLWPR